MEEKPPDETAVKGVPPEGDDSGTAGLVPPPVPKEPEPAPDPKTEER